MQIGINIAVKGARTSGPSSTPVNSSPPFISGTTTIGSVLTSTFGGWLNSPTSYAFQWNRNGSPIPSATSSTYTLVLADSASAITCVVTATNAFGSTPSTSNTLTTPTYAAAFTSTWDVTAGETITLPYEAAGTYSGTIDWGDSSTSTNSYANRTHTYVGAGTYTISITGVTTGFRFNNTGSRLNIRTITNWGTLRLGNSGSYFYGCSNLTLTTVAGTLDLTGTTNLSGLFWACSALTTVNGINSWSTGSVTNMSNMFNSCTNFNQALSFNTGAVTNMSQMFYNCSVFNSSLTFNTANVTSMTSMFIVCDVFNQPLNFNTASVTSFQSMFFGCPNFNSKCTFTTTAVGCSAQEMFYACNSFNEAPIFTSTANITNMNRMFSVCGSFNKPLTFDTTSVTNMSYMFAGSTVFNSALTFSSTAAVTNMSNMFDGATAFNQNIGSWNVANVTNFTSFMLGKTPATFSAANLDAIYNGWSAQSVQSSLNISFGTAKYSAAGTAGRNYLTGTKLWTITDGGL